MQYIFSSEEMRRCDSKAINEFGIHGAILMENAARFSADAIGQINEYDSAVIFCGKGNNGGDGWALARHMKSALKDVLVVYTDIPSSDEARANMDVCVNLDISMLPADEISLDALEHYDILIDAIFGIGLNSAPEGRYAELIEMINLLATASPIFSLDMPSGLDSDTGLTPGAYVEADAVLTFGGLKRGFFQHTGARFFDKVYGDPISMPPEVLHSTVELFQRPVLMARKADSHKYSNGVITVIGGSEKYPAAPGISAYGALKSGAGMVYCLTPDGERISSPEIIYGKLEQKRGHLTGELGKWKESVLKSDVIVLGPGIGSAAAAKAFIEALKEIKYSGTVICDAEAVKAGAKAKNTSYEIVLTPHPGEFKGIGGHKDGDMFKSLKEVFSKVKKPILLKNSYPFFIDNDGQTYVSQYTSAYLSKAGTGDLLSGVIASFIAQGYSFYDALNISLFLTGVTAIKLEQRHSHLGITATLLADNFNLALESLDEE